MMMMMKWTEKRTERRYQSIYRLRSAKNATTQIVQGAPIKKQSLRKNAVIQLWWHGFEPNFQTLYGSILATYAVNFILLTGMVKQIQQFKI